MRLSLCDWVFPKGTKLFDLPGRSEPLRGILWGARALLICGHEYKCPCVKPNLAVRIKTNQKLKFNPKLQVHTYEVDREGDSNPWITLAREPCRGAARHILTKNTPNGQPMTPTSRRNPPSIGQGPSRWASKNIFCGLPCEDPVETTQGTEGEQPIPTKRLGPGHRRRRPRVLDLFSGTGSVGKVFKQHGWEVISVDNHKRWNPTHCVDVLNWDYTTLYTPGDFDMVVCSPPCTEFSQAKTTKPRDLESADRLVRKALEIIKYLAPARWWLKNPRNGLLGTREYMAGYPHADADYCQYSDWGYQKPTRFWGSDHLRNLTLRTCDGRTCPNLVTTPLRRGVQGKHRTPLGGPHLNTTKFAKYRIPETLIEEISGLRNSFYPPSEFTVKRPDLPSLGTINPVPPLRLRDPR